MRRDEYRDEQGLIGINNQEGTKGMRRDEWGVKRHDDGDNNNRIKDNGGDGGAGDVVVDCC